MERQEIDGELTRPGARDLLTAPRLARLGYLGQDGTPRVVPVGFHWTGHQVVMATAVTAPKVSALYARPDVALTIDAGETPHEARSLSLRGRADVTIVDGVPDEYLAGAAKFLDADAAAEFERNCRAIYGQMARIAVTPGWARYYDFGAGPVPGFMQDLAAQAGSRQKETTHG